MLYCSGGIYPFDEWFDACDERGILVFEDMMYGTDGIMPGASATPNQEAELRHQIRRMGQYPPSPHFTFREIIAAPHPDRL